MNVFGAMEYEYLIRRAYNCGRFGTAGANADIFRGLERYYAQYLAEIKKEKSVLEEKDLAFKYGVRCGEVAAFMIDSIEHVLKRSGLDINEVQRGELNHCVSELHHPKFEKIVEVIERAQKVMLELGLYPG